MFPKLTQEELELIQEFQPDLSNQNALETLENVNQFLIELGKVFPQNDFAKVWIFNSTGNTANIIEEAFQTTKHEKGSVLPYFEGNEIVDISFILHIPNNYFPYTSRKIKRGLFGEVGRELATFFIHPHIGPSRVQEEREKAVEIEVEIETFFIKIQLSLKFTGEVEINIFSHDEFGDNKIPEMGSFYEIYISKISPLLKTIILSEKSSIKFTKPDDVRQNGSKETVSSINATLTPFETLLFMKTIHQNGFIVGEFPRV